MPSPVVAETITEIRETVGVLESARVALTLFPERIQTAVKAALDAGATPEQLAPITEELAIQKAKRDEVVAAIAANAT